MHFIDTAVDCVDIDKRIKQLIVERELIDSFELLYAENEGSDYHVQIGRTARQLRRVEIEDELRYLCPLS